MLREIRRELPAEDLIYVADSAFAPYGGQSDKTIIERSITITRFLTERSAKAIVVACNTATAVAVNTLRSTLGVPVVAMEPAVKPATLNTRSAVVGVLATTHTLASSKFSKLLAAYGADVEILLQPCPGLVEQVERADLAGPDTLALVERYVAPLLARGADTLVLGCTHYPFLAGSIRQVAGPGVEIIDPSPAVARELRRRLETAGLLSQQAGQGKEQFWTSAPPESVRTVMAQLWSRDIDLQRMP